MQNTAQVIPFAPTDDNDVVEGLLVNLTLRSWKARKKDQRVTAEVANQNSVMQDVGAYHKRLFSKDALSEIGADTYKARQEHWRLTLPWADSGQRLLPMANLEEYSTNMTAWQNKIEGEVKVFLDNYEGYVADAEKILGDLYDPKDYPPVEVVAKKFSFHREWSEIPTGDIRGGAIGEDQRIEMESGIKANTMQKVYDAVEVKLQGLVDQLIHYRDNICGENPKLDGKKPAFKDSSLNNCGRELAIARSINLTNDPRIHAACDAIEGLVAEITQKDANGDLIHATHLRNSPTFRKNQAQKADDALKSIGWA